MTNKDIYYDILQKKYNILKKNLIIIEQSDEKIDEFKKTIKNIDEIEQDIFKKELESKKEITTNLEDEYKRLYDYINLIEERHRKRKIMLDDYYNIIKKKYSDLEEIEDYENIDFYTKRLEDISEFLINDEKYVKLNKEKDNYNNLSKEFEEKYSLLKKQLDEFNLNLLIKLKNSISNNSLYDKLDFDNIDDSISSYTESLNTKEKELSTYLNSYNALINANITIEEKDDYLKFIEEEKKEYLDLLEKKYILLIYKYVNANDNENALNSYEERNNKIKLYELNDNSDLIEVFDIIKIYMEKNEELKDIELSLDSINNNIKQVEDKLNELKDELNKDNIKTLLKEFCIEKDYIVNNNDEVVEDFIYENEIISNKELPIEVEMKEEQDIEIIEKDTNAEIDNIDELIESIENVNNDVNAKEEVKFSNEEIFSEEKENTNVENNLLFDYNDEKNNEVKEEIIYKDNSIIEIKNISDSLSIDNIRQKALNIMKSVCESI